MNGIVSKQVFDTNFFKSGEAVQVGPVKPMPYPKKDFDENRHCIILDVTPLEMQVIYIKFNGQEEAIIKIDEIDKGKLIIKKLSAGDQVVSGEEKKDGEDAW